MSDFEWTRPGMRVWSPAELKAARAAAVARFEEIARRLTPQDVRITFVKGLYGRAFVGERRFYAPRPTTRRRLHIYLHEVAHIVLDHRGQKPRHVEEMEAEQWAFKAMRGEGVSVPLKSIRSAKRYVARKIAQARRRGAKRIDKRAAAFAR